MTQRISNRYNTSGKRPAPPDHDDSARDPQAESLQAQALIHALSELADTTQVQAFMARVSTELLSRQPALVLAVASAATRGVGENADALDDIARQCLQATRLMPEPSGADAVAVWQSLIAQLYGLQGRLARTLLQALESFPMPEAVRPDCERARQAASLSTPSTLQTLMSVSTSPHADLVRAQPLQGNPASKGWPIEVVKLVAWPPASATTLGSMTAFYRELSHCMAWMLVNKELKAAQQAKFTPWLRDWVSQWRPTAHAAKASAPPLPSIGMLRIYNYGFFLDRPSSRGEPLFLALDEATQTDAPRQLQTLLPYLWAQACGKWTLANEQAQLVKMGQRLLAQVERCSLAVQRRLLVGLAYGGDRALREEALRRLSLLESHPSFQHGLRLEHIRRCLSPARLSSEDIDAVLLDLEQTPLDQATELPYLRQLAKVSQQTLTQSQYERALNCTIVLRRFEAHCDRLGVPQTAHQTIYFELGQQLSTTSAQAYKQLETST